MASGIFNATMEQGADWTLELTLFKNTGLPISLVGYTGECKIRATHGAIVVLASPTVTFLTPKTSGKVKLYLPASITEDFVFNTAYYDLFITDPNGLVSKIIEGKITLKPSITI